MLSQKIVFFTLTILFNSALYDVPFFKSLLILEVQAQVNCETAFTEAETEYELGNWDRVILLLEPCLPNEITKIDRVHAFEYLFLSYYYVDSLEQSKNTIKKLLNDNPTYEPSDKVPVELKTFIKKEKRSRKLKIIRFYIGGGVILVSLITVFIFENRPSPPQKLPRPPGYPSNK